MNLNKYWLMLFGRKRSVCDGSVGFSTLPAMAKIRCWFVCCGKPVLVKDRRPVPAELRERSDAHFVGDEVIHDNCRRKYDLGGNIRDRLFVPRVQRNIKAKPVSSHHDNSTVAFVDEHCMRISQQISGSLCASLLLSCADSRIC